MAQLPSPSAQRLARYKQNKPWEPFFSGMQLTMVWMFGWIRMRYNEGYLLSIGREAIRASPGKLTLQHLRFVGNMWWVEMKVVHITDTYNFHQLTCIRFRKPSSENAKRQALPSYSLSPAL